ncbi:hypothetical protein Hanom_Chr02g00151971 [Helianthus anomalus]
MNLGEMNLDVINEIHRRINVCCAAKRDLIYDNKRGCYIDKNANPLDFVKIFCAGTYNMETKEITKKEESVKIGSSSSESMCSKYNQLEAENGKLMKDVENLTLEVRKLKDEKQADVKQILVLLGNC